MQSSFEISPLRDRTRMTPKTLPNWQNRVWVGYVPRWWGETRGGRIKHSTLLCQIIITHCCDWDCDVTVWHSESNVTVVTHCCHKLLQCRGEKWDWWPQIAPWLTLNALRSINSVLSFCGEDTGSTRVLVYRLASSMYYRCDNLCQFDCFQDSLQQQPTHLGLAL